MPFRPDIVVTEPDSPRILLVVETKAQPQDLSQMGSQMKRYMVQMSCPLGLLVTPAEIVLYKDRYVGRTEDSVEQIGRYSAPSPWQEWRSRRDWEFEGVVRSWLDRVRSSKRIRDFPPEAADALASYLLPALSAGVIRGAGPHEQPAG